MDHKLNCSFQLVHYCSIDVSRFRAPPFSRENLQNSLLGLHGQLFNHKEDLIAWYGIESLAELLLLIDISFMLYSSSSDSVIKPIKCERQKHFNVSDWVRPYSKTAFHTFFCKCLRQVNQKHNSIDLVFSVSRPSKL